MSIMYHSVCWHVDLHTYTVHTYTHIYIYLYMYMHWSFISIFFNHIIMYIERFYFHTHVKIYTITCFCDFYVTVNPCCPGPAIFNFWSQDNSPQKGAVGVVEFGTGDLRLCGLKQHLEKKAPFSGHQTLHSEIIGVAMLQLPSCCICLERFLWGLIPMNM